MTSIISNRCYMLGCKNNRILREKKASMKMFLFPRNKQLAKVWLSICNHQPYECPYHGQTICKDHFRPEHFVREEGTEMRTRLKPNVIPTTNIPNICYSLVAEYFKNKLDSNDDVSIPLSVNVEFTCSKITCQDPDRALSLYENVTKNVKSAKHTGKQNKKQSRDNSSDSPPPYKTLKLDSPSSSDDPDFDSNSDIESESLKSNVPANFGTSGTVGQCKIVERKTIVLPKDIQTKIVQVLKSMTDIVQNFMAFQIYFMHLEQKIVNVNEKVTESIRDWDLGEIHLKLYAKQRVLHTFLLKLYEIHGILSSDTIPLCTKIWTRAIDCHKEMKSQGQLKTFITSANGCLVTIVKVIDSVIRLKSMWMNLLNNKRIPLGCLNSEELKYLINDYEWKNFDDEIFDLVNEASQKLQTIDNEIHMTRQKILDIKKPAIRIMEVTQMNIHSDMIYVSEYPPSHKPVIKEKTVNTKTVKPPENQKTIEKPSATSPNKLKITLKNVNNSVLQTNSPAMESPNTGSVATTSPTPGSNIVLNIPVSASNTHSTSPPCLTPIIPSATMSSVPQIMPMSAQLIPTLQMDAFGNQTIVYQIAYQPVAPTIDQSINNLMPQLIQPTLTLPANTAIMQHPLQQQQQQSPNITQTSQNASQITPQQPQQILQQQFILNESVTIKEEPDKDNDNLDTQTAVMKVEENVTIKLEPE